MRPPSPQHDKVVVHLLPVSTLRPPPAPHITRGWVNELVRRFLHAESNTDPLPYGWLRISVADCPGMVAVALASGRDVGIDIEPLDRDIEPDLVAGCFMNDAEYREYVDVFAQPSPQAVLWWWTRKEALLKAAGAGSTRRPAHFTVPVRFCLGDKPVQGPGGPYVLVDQTDVVGFAMSVACRTPGDVEIIRHQANQLRSA